MSQGRLQNESKHHPPRDQARAAGPAQAVLGDTEAHHGAKENNLTCIAWDGKTLAADKLADNAGLKLTVTKIYRLKDGSLFGYAGIALLGLLMKDWIEAGCNPADFPEVQKDKDEWGTCVVISDSGARVYQRFPIAITFEDKQLAFGSGRDYALAAMHLGKTAREGVEIACIFEAGCGNGVDVLTL
jgi:ATP-dependent protease HslVU (ClpYQ) peptidase subunit